VVGRRSPCKESTLIVKKNGTTKTIYTYSYVAVLAEKNGSAVKAVRMNGFERKADVLDTVRQEYPGWNVKCVYKLYDDDFEERGM